MSKPRFPLSVTRSFVYRAFMPVSGEILECDTFKELYRFARRYLRAETLYKLKPGEYRYSEARLEFGYVVEYEDRPGYYYGDWHTIHDFGTLQISTLSEYWYSTEDEANHEIHTK